MERRGVAITGVGVVNAAASARRPRWARGSLDAAGPATSDPRPAVRVPEATLSALVDGDEARRLSRVCQLDDRGGTTGRR